MPYAVPAISTFVKRGRRSIQDKNIKLIRTVPNKKNGNALRRSTSPGLSRSMSGVSKDMCVSPYYSRKLASFPLPLSPRGEVSEGLERRFSNEKGSVQKPRFL